jgi:RHS repeat-associated protein
VNNQISGYGYDAAGNMTSDPTDGGITLSYDQENRIQSTAGYTYTYDADGNRVKKTNGTTGTLYWYMSPGIVAESDLSGTLKSEYVFFDGERVARRDLPAGSVAYYFSDHLKTASVITDSLGNIKSESDYYPWGGELQFINNDSNHYKFTGKERDETGLDYFGARYYSNGLARFITPDWAAKATAVPYAEFSDPQSLNLYTYVRNVPTVKIDPDGHCCDLNDAMSFVAGLANALGSNNALGAGRVEQTSNAGRMGQAVGDAVSTVQGTAEALFGGGVEGMGLALDSTGVGAVLGVPLNVAGAGIIAHGTTTAVVSGVHLAADVSKSGGSSTGTDESKPHGNTAGDQPAELYEKHDANGNFEKHGVSQDASKRYSKKEISGGTVKVTDRGSRKEMLKKERHNVETNPGPKNKEPWAGKKQDK